ncbi:MAG: lysA, partial [Alphaproteobacteria bacterium]|nr:lysA [Alphaproteobacteria bacterium]
MTQTTAYKNSRLRMEDVELASVAEKFGTPLYCYSAGQIEKNYEAYRRALKSVTDDFTICYATKANSNIAVLKVLQKRGAGADIVSGGELRRALAAGISPKKIVYSGVGKSDEEITFAIKTGIMQINVESEPELVSISRIAKKLKKTVDVSIRINPNVDAKTHAKITTGKKENKFGI